MDKSDIGIYVAWFGVAVIVVWAILKSIGVIQSPTYQEMAPYFGGAAAFGGLIATIRHLGKEIKEFKDETKNSFKEVRTEIKEVRDQVSHLDKDMEVLKDRFGRAT